MDSFSPPRQHFFDPVGDLLAGYNAVHSICQQLVVRGMFVANCGYDR
jgi:hypothetical protein